MGYFRLSRYINVDGFEHGDNINKYDGCLRRSWTCLLTFIIYIKHKLNMLTKVHEHLSQPSYALIDILLQLHVIIIMQINIIIIIIIIKMTTLNKDIG